MDTMRVCFLEIAEVGLKIVGYVRCEKTNHNKNDLHKCRRGREILKSQNKTV